MLEEIEEAFAERDLTEERLRRFVADAGHELRTPLATIRGHAELLRTGVASTPSEVGRAVERIESESVRMTRLVDDLLLLARLDAAMPLYLRPVDREPWVAGTVDLFDRADLLSQFDLGAGLPAIATSGTAERGEHVWPTSGSTKGDPFVQVTAAAPDIVTADVLATAILSGGAWTLQLATSTWPVEVVTVSRSGALRATAAFHRAA